MKDPEERRTRDSLKRAGDSTVRGVVQVAETVVPGLSILVEHVRSLQAEKQRRRMEEFIAFALGPEPSEGDRERFERDLDSESFCFEAFRKIFEDEEAEKTWAYAALFGAFGRNQVQMAERVHLLRLFRDLTCAELRTMLSWCALAGPEKVAIDDGLAEDDRARHRNLTSELLNAGLLREAQDGMRFQAGRVLRPTRSFYLVAEILRQARKPEGWVVEPARFHSDQTVSSDRPEALVTVVANALNPRWGWVRAEGSMEVNGEVKLTNRGRSSVFVTDLLLEVDGATVERTSVMVENVISGGFGQDVPVPSNQVASVHFGFRVQPVLSKERDPLKGRLRVSDSLGGRHEMPVEFPCRG